MRILLTRTREMIKHALHVRVTEPVIREHDYVFFFFFCHTSNYTAMRLFRVIIIQKLDVGKKRVFIPVWFITSARFRGERVSDAWADGRCLACCLCRSQSAGVSCGHRRGHVLGNVHAHRSRRVQVKQNYPSIVLYNYFLFFFSFSLSFSFPI